METADEPSVFLPEKLLYIDHSQLNKVLRELVCCAGDTTGINGTQGLLRRERLAVKAREQQALVRQLLQRLLNDRDHNQMQFTPKELQIDILLRVAFGKEDTILIAPTGFGKSLIFQAWSMLSGLCTIVVVPLLGLADQIADDISAIPGMKPIVVTSETKAQTKDIYRTMRYGSHTHIILSPEQLLAPEFQALLRVPEFSMTIGALVIDEAHCVAMWSSFRSEYARIASVRPLIPPEAVLFACTATIDANIEKRIIEDCGFGYYKSWDAPVGVIRASVDRPDISIVFNSLPRDQHLHGLLFVLQPAITLHTVEDIEAHDLILPLKLTVIFANTRSEVRIICGWLRQVLQHYGYSQRAVRTGVTTYTSRTAKKDRLSRVKNMKDESSALKILVATSAFGMGLDVPNIELGVQYKAMFPDSFTPNAMNMIVIDLMQRIGRVARGVDRTGKFVVLYEHDVAHKEDVRRRSWLKKIGKSQPTSKPTNVPLSRRGSGTIHPRRNSSGIDPSGMRSTPTKAVDGLTEPPDSEFPDVEGMIAALSEPLPDEERTTGTSGRLDPLYFTWTRAISASCKRKFLLLLLGNHRCRVELQTEEVPPIDCCNHCNPELFSIWDYTIPSTITKVRSPSQNEPLAFITLQYIRRWAADEAAIVCPNSEFDLFDVPVTVFIPDQIQIRLCRSTIGFTDRPNLIYLIDDGPNSYITALKELESYNQQTKHRFVKYMTKDHVSSLWAEFAALKDRRLTTTQSTQAVSQLTETSTVSQSDESMSIQVGENHNISTLDQVPLRDVSTETQDLLVQSLSLRVQQHEITPVYKSSTAFSLPLQLRPPLVTANYYTTPSSNTLPDDNSTTIYTETRLQPSRLLRPSQPAVQAPQTAAQSPTQNLRPPQPPVTPSQIPAQDQQVGAQSPSKLNQAPPTLVQALPTPVQTGQPADQAVQTPVQNLQRGREPRSRGSKQRADQDQEQEVSRQAPEPSAQLHRRSGRSTRPSARLRTIEAESSKGLPSTQRRAHQSNGNKRDRLSVEQRAKTPTQSPEKRKVRRL